MDNPAAMEVRLKPQDVVLALKLVVAPLAAQSWLEDEWCGGGSRGLRPQLP
jgi:hypothetical protein